MDHYESQRKHAVRRALERYGVDLSGNDLREIVLLIQKNKSVVIATQSHTRAVHDIVYGGVRYRAVYHKKTKQISTFLPPGEETRPYITNAQCGENYGY